MNECISQCISGSYTIKQVSCKELPFSRNVWGAITFNGEVYLERTHTNMFGMTKKLPFDTDVGNEIIKALNNAYRLGYEKDRVTYE